MKVVKIEPSDVEQVRKILRIHDQMPTEWDVDHRPSDEWLARVLLEIQSAPEPVGFWVLTDGKPGMEIHGFLWTGIKRIGRDDLGCSIKSLWIRPEFRKRNLSAKLTEACVKWAKEQGAARLICSTHVSNSRMRTILERNQFQAGMIDYTLPIA